MKCSVEINMINWNARTLIKIKPQKFLFIESHRLTTILKNLNFLIQQEAKHGQEKISAEQKLKVC